ncbi:MULTISPECIES: hypothetical protein [Virgibacillus]|uniref:Uncharacterized protein n=1 Tax=Virgibacillus halodenitrificans TaxID=1482 RepID=A0AAC9J362_VIRHA|nr:MULTISPECIES: hypothetical protein [Virgibacillus]AIF45618.1 hypothetical protein X953_17935 [Virgibacillus sp. SK37]APC49864.1 hypothetical protein BME96_17410 [Virgibacillus halodenitrificans]MBD1223499.1 hypothetical protein [Virgibacillus halodenitrificans]MCG1029144.1 hypothetical protein [Virgibacillus halodenitrificans]MCJ0932753.1 hypothetical protein [Virgibacillus halodenitrificans]
MTIKGNSVFKFIVILIAAIVIRTLLAVFSEGGYHPYTNIVVIISAIITLVLWTVWEESRNK